jgi:hypothetical protein
VVGLWICAYILKNNVDKYVKKKMDAYYDQQIKESRPRPRARGRPPLHRDRFEQKMDKMDKQSPSHNDSPSEQEIVSISEE